MIKSMLTILVTPANKRAIMDYATCELCNVINITRINDEFRIHLSYDTHVREALEEAHTLKGFGTEGPIWLIDGKGKSTILIE